MIRHWSPISGGAVIAKVIGSIAHAVTLRPLPSKVAGSDPLPTPFFVA